MTDAQNIREIFEKLRDYLEVINISDQENTIFEWKRDKFKRFDLYLMSIRQNPISDVFFNLNVVDLIFVNIRKNNISFTIGANSKVIY